MKKSINTFFDELTPYVPYFKVKNADEQESADGQDPANEQDPVDEQDPTFKTERLIKKMLRFYEV